MNFAETIKIDLYTLILSAAALITAASVIWVKLLKPAVRLLRETAEDSRISRFLIEGQHEIRDPLSRQIIQEALPPIGARVRTVELDQKSVHEQVSTLAMDVKILEETVKKTGTLQIEQNSALKQDISEIKRALENLEREIK